MINLATQIRIRLMALLHNAVTYDSQLVPVYETQAPDALPYKIIIGEYSDADQSSKNHFGATARQVIEVVAEQSTAYKKHVDAIGELVMNELNPTPRANLLSAGPMNVYVGGRPGTSHLVEDSGEGTKIVRLLLQYNLIIHEL